MQHNFFSKNNIEGFTQHHFFFKKSGAGFTLIELIVSISIIGLMAGFVMADYRSAGKKTILHVETQKFAGDIRRAQNMALGSLDFNGVTPVGGWGIYIVDANTYYLFVDNDAVGSGNHGKYNNGDSIAESVSLSEKVIFSANIGTSIVFLPPDPKVYINGVNSGSVVITLQQVDDVSETKNIVLNYFGLLDISD